MAWISPTGHNDPDGKWTDETYAYDDDTETDAYNASYYYDYYLELTIAEILCDKVRIWAQDKYGIPRYDPDLDIDVYYGGDWHNIWSGVITKNTWVEKAIGSSQLVTKARVKSNTSDKNLLLGEFDFGEALQVETDACSNPTPSSLQANGDIVCDGGSTVTRRGFCYAKSGEEVGAWVSPIGHNDPDGKWTQETWAYDGNTGTNASNADSNYGYYLELTIAEIKCDKVRIYAADYYLGFSYDPDLDIDVYYGGDWHNIWSGVITKNTWVEKAIGSSQLVTKARVKSNTSNRDLRIYELEFNDLAPNQDDSVVDEEGSFGEGEFDLTIEDLSPATNYRVRAFAENADGIAYGNTVTGTTGQALVITPSPASAICLVVAPSVIKGSISITPSPASAVCSVVAPTIPLISTITTETHELSSSYLSQRKLVRTSDGVLHTVYERNDEYYISQIYHAYSSDEGKSWDEEALTSGSYHQAEPSIAVDSHDNLHVVWAGYSSSSPDRRQIRYRKYDGSWGSIANLTSGNYHQRYPSIAIDSNDYLHVVWHGTHSGSTTYNQIRYIKYTGSWGSIENLTSAGYGNYEPSIAIDSNDYIHVVWSGDKIEYRKYTDSWQDIEVIEGSAYPQDCPCIAVDANDYVHVVWFGTHAGSTNYDQIRYRKYTDSWQDIENLTSGDYDSYEPSIAVEGNDYLHVVWHGESPKNPLGYQQIRHIKYTGSWGDIEDLTSIDVTQYYPNLLCANHPGDRGKTKAGFAFIWVDGTTLKYYASADLAWGNVYCLPELVSAIASVVAPAVIAGSLILTPDYVACIAQVVQPNVRQGNITFSPTPIDAIAKAVNPTVIHGSLSLSPDFVAAIAKGIDPTVILGSITASPEFVKAIAQVVAPIVSGGVVYVTPDPASSIAGIVAPTVVLGSIVITPDEVYAIAQVVAPNVKLGSIIISNGIAETAAQVVAPTVIGGDITVTPESIEAIARGENPEVILASMTVTPEFVRALAGVIAPTVLQTWVGRKLKVVIVTTQKRKVNVLTTQYRKVDVVTTQKRKVRVLTGV